MSEHGGWQRGITQVYTGDGKGKTTAAVGLAMRAAGAGLRVYFTHFCKGQPTSEHEAFARFEDLIVWNQSGSCGFVVGAPSAEDIAAARNNLEALRGALTSGDYRVVIADEFNVAVDLGLITVTEAEELIDDRPHDVELVLTGRNAAPEVMARADLVTEMLAIKHPYQGGLKGRRGVEW